MTSGRDLWLPPQMVEFGYLPHVCVRHGLPARRMERAPVYSRTPAWVLPLVLISLLLGLLIALALRETVWGPWPVCHRCIERREQYRKAMWACLSGSVLTVIAAVALNAPALLLLEIPLIAAAIVLRGLGDWYRVTSAAVDRARTAVHVRSPAGPFVAALSGPVPPQPAFTTYGSRPS